MEYNDEELNILLNSRKGGKTTRQIIEQLFDGPKNANDIAKILQLNYKTITYHLKIAHKYDYVKLQKINGITFYSVTDKLYKNKEYNNILNKQKN